VASKEPYLGKKLALMFKFYVHNGGHNGFGPKHDDRIYLVEQTNEPLAGGVADVGSAVGETHKVGQLSLRGRFYPKEEEEATSGYPCSFHVGCYPLNEGMREGRKKNALR
jgi:hypothetical protein